MISAAYHAQVDLLLRILPQVATESVFALKGGTAINLFVRDMPRFSVDIDLTYLPISDRITALQEIGDGLRRIKQRIDKAIQGVSSQVATQSGGQEAKLICRLHQAIVKIEVNTVIRGHLWPTRNLALSQPTQDEFKKSARISVVSHSELFGGKICAALDRQHPRDLFDIQQLYEHEGLSDEVRLGFIVSLLSHPRPMHELLRPQLTDQRRVYDTQFAGMPFIPYSYEDFESTRERLVKDIPSLLHDNDRKLLLSVKKGAPDWGLFPIAGLDRMPAVQWKLENINKLKKNIKKHAEQLKELEAVLET